MSDKPKNEPPSQAEKDKMQARFAEIGIPVALINLPSRGQILNAVLAICKAAKKRKVK